MPQSKTSKLILKIVFVLILLYHAKIEAERFATLSDEEKDQISQNAEPPDNGYDLEDYLRHEFDLPGRQPWPDNLRPIRFWNIQRFQEVRWADGSCVFDNRRGILP